MVDEFELEHDKKFQILLQQHPVTQGAPLLKRIACVAAHDMRCSA